MPRRGYRKGVSDCEPPLVFAVRTNLTEDLWIGLQREALDRGMTHAALLRELIVAHVTRARPHLPRPNGPNKELVREVARIGNNLNQLTRQANSGFVTVTQDALAPVLADLIAALKRI